MILVTMGTQPLACDRIINSIIDAQINDEIIVQVNYDIDKDKITDNIKHHKLISYEKMDDYIRNADIVVVSGTGGILRALLLEKKVIIFPRLGKYNEAADDHGAEMKILASEGYAEFVGDGEKFIDVYNRCKQKQYKKFKSNQKKFITELQRELTKL